MANVQQQPHVMQMQSTVSFLSFDFSFAYKAYGMLLMCSANDFPVFVSKCLLNYVTREYKINCALKCSSRLTAYCVRFGVLLEWPMVLIWNETS